ncbi:MAG: oxidoreductase [Nocardioidaceae bacterium]|nr:oxidoreductase [Nocardioidaceae bacterium]
MPVPMPTSADPPSTGRAIQGPPTGAADPPASEPAAHEPAHAPATGPVRWGILATGGIAETFCRDLALVPGAEIAAVGSRSTARAAEFGARHGAARTYGSHAGLLSDPDVDVVYVATPHPFHMEAVLAAIEAGKAVLCEKPLGMRASESEAMVAAARRRGTFLMEAMWMRCTPGVRRLRSLVDEGRVGQVRSVQADLGDQLSTDPAARWQNPDLGASTLLDVGVYPLTFVTMLLGEPKALVGQAVLSGRGVDNAAGLVLTYDSGAIATVTCSQHARTGSTATVSGDRGRIEVAAPIMAPPSLRLVATAGDDPDPELFTDPIIGVGMAHEAIEVHRCLQAGLTESPLVPLDETVLVARLLDQARQACGVVLPGDR